MAHTIHLFKGNQIHDIISFIESTSNIYINIYYTYISSSIRCIIRRLRVCLMLVLGYMSYQLGCQQQSATPKAEAGYACQSIIPWHVRRKESTTPTRLSFHIALGSFLDIDLSIAMSSHQGHEGESRRHLRRSEMLVVHALDNAL